MVQPETSTNPLEATEKSRLRDAKGRDIAARRQKTAHWTAKSALSAVFRGWISCFSPIFWIIPAIHQFWDVKGREVG